MNFDVPKCTRICATTNRELKPGEWFYSVLFEEDNAIKRMDYSQDGWQEPQHRIIGYWKSRMPTVGETKVKLAPNDILHELFDQLGDQLDKIEMRYVLTLLLIRRRILRLEREETTENGDRTLIVYSPKREANYMVSVTNFTDGKINEVQAVLADLLYAGS